jgi:hypothetical protein
MENLNIGARVNHPKFGEGIVCGSNVSFVKIFFREHGDKEIARDFEGMEVIEPSPEVDNALSIEDVKVALTQVLQKFADFTVLVPMGDKWIGGTLLMQPANTELKPKEVPIETFFHKIVMLRDRLRVLEQQINAHDKLTDEDKINLQQYITRIYGSLTTFNVLFKDEKHHFKGEAGKEK